MMKPDMDNKALKMLEGLLSKQKAMLSSNLLKAKEQLTPEQYTELEGFLNDAFAGKNPDPQLFIEKFKNIADTN